MSKPSSSKWLLRLVIALAVVGAIAWTVSYMLRPTAITALAFRGKAVRAVSGTVEVKAEYENELKSEVSGRVSASELDVGKRVMKNDMLVQVDTGDIDIEIERIKNEIVAAKRKVELGSTLRPEVLNAKDTLENLERQTKAGAYPAAEFEKQKRLFEQLQQKMELDEVNTKLALENFLNTLRAKEREKSKMTIVASADGVVTSVMARVGSLIGSNSTIATIIATGRTVEGKLSEENFAAIKLGQKATVRFLTFGGDHYNAVISKILPSADATTQRYTIYLDVRLPEGRVLTPGITGEMSIIISERDNAVLIPRRALLGEYVYVINGGKVEVRKVTKGYEGLNQVEITEGLAADDIVVVEQQDRLREGESVRYKVIKS